MITSTLVFSVGIFTILYFTWKISLFLYVHLAPVLQSTPGLARYTRDGNSKAAWALITGGSSGIGYGFAQSLLSRKFNVILVSRSAKRLEDAKHRLEQEFRITAGSDRIRILVLEASTSTPEEMRSTFLAPSVADCNITILVNNVGGIPISSPIFRPLAQYSLPEVDAVMDINGRFAARITALLLPTLMRNSPSLVLNVGSGAHVGMPLIGMYGAAKGFLRAFSIGLAREIRGEGTGVDVMYLTVGETQSNSNVIDVDWKTPSSRGLAEATVDRVGAAVKLGWIDWSPWWAHGILSGLLECMPESMTQSVLIDAMLKKKKQFDKE